jgi:tetratricopeptide (TPR) repeat protein
MKRRLVSLLSAALVVSTAASARAQIGRVNGLVRSEDGQSVKGVTITAENNDTGQSLTATSDDKGRFILIGLRTGLWYFYAQAPGFAPQGGDMAVRTGGQNPPIGFVLKKNGAANFGALAGIAAKDLQTDLAGADALFKQNRWDDAIAAYRSVLAKAPPLNAINLQIALAYRSKKDYPAALAAYNDLLKADPNNEKAKIGISMTHLDRGDAKAAEAALLPAAQSPTAGREVLFNLGEIESAKGDAADAARWYERASAVDASWGKPLYKLGMGAAKAGDKERAGRLLNRILIVDPSSPEAELARSALDSLNR